MSATERVIALIDMDCFYCQVEQKLNPSLYGKPVAVVQYNAWRGGGLIAVNYEARARGVTRHMRGNEAKKICPEIELARVPNIRQKADLTRYRDAGKQVAEVLQDYTSLLERASVDEAYLDITESVLKRLESFKTITADKLKNSHVVGYDTPADFLNEIGNDEHLHESDIKLAIGGVITEEIRAAVYDRTGYRCSAGVAHNKILAKLTCGLHKPNQQTILPHESVPKLYENLSIKKIQSMGGKFGDEVIEKLQLSTMKDLINFSKNELQQHFENKTANWLYDLARGINNDPVTIRLISKSIGCCKKFPGRTALLTEKLVKHWMNELSIEIAERIVKDIAENNRKPKQIIVNYGQRFDRKEVTNSRCQALNSVEQEKIFQETYEVVKKNCQKKDGSFCITFLGLNVSKFEENKNMVNITSFFKNSPKGTNVKQENQKKSTTKEIELFVKDDKDVGNSKEETLQKNEYTFKNNNSSKPSETIINSKNPNISEDNYNSDDSTAELEAINASVIESNNQGDVSMGKTKIKNSFFNKYLQNVKEPTRNFNTSAILGEVEDNKESEDSIEDSKQPESPKTPVMSAKELKTNAKPNILNFLQNNYNESPSTSKTNIDGKELCTECNKLIPREEIVSHMDYHFAINIVKEEAHLYKPKLNSKESKEDLNNESNKKRKTNNNNSNINNKNANPSRKRKTPQGNRVIAADITSYFNKQDEDSGDDYELCSECRKRIKLDDMPSHIDYHVAKKLHQEINYANASNKDTQISSNNNINGINKKVNLKGNSSVAQYFTKL